MSRDIHDVALRMLARRALSARELAERLERRGFSPRAAAAEVQRLTAAGLVNDEALAESLVQVQLQRGRGRRAVGAALRRRRLDPGAVQRGEELVGEEEERESLARALAAAARRFPVWRRLPERRRKVVRYLLARGFRAGLVRQAVAAAPRGDAEDAVDVEPGTAPDVS